MRALLPVFITSISACAGVESDELAPLADAKADAVATSAPHAADGTGTYTFRLAPLPLWHSTRSDYYASVAVGLNQRAEIRWNGGLWGDAINVSASCDGSILGDYRSAVSLDQPTSQTAGYAVYTHTNEYAHGCTLEFSNGNAVATAEVVVNVTNVR